MSNPVNPSPARSSITALFGSAVLAITLSMLASPIAAQTRMTANVTSSSTQMKAVCGSREVVSSRRGDRTTYSCKTKPQRAAANTSSGAGATTRVKAADDGGLRAEINCSYSESGGQNTWLGCTCKANDDGNCTNFITWCAEQGDEVGGNSGSASCSPGG